MVVSVGCRTTEGLNPTVAGPTVTCPLGLRGRFANETGTNCIGALACPAVVSLIEAVVGLDNGALIVIGNATRGARITVVAVVNLGVDPGAETRVCIVAGPVVMIFWVPGGP